MYRPSSVAQSRSAGAISSSTNSILDIKYAGRGGSNRTGTGSGGLSTSRSGTYFDYPENRFIEATNARSLQDDFNNRSKYNCSKIYLTDYDTVASFGSSLPPGGHHPSSATVTVAGSSGVLPRATLSRFPTSSGLYQPKSASSSNRGNTSGPYNNSTSVMSINTAGPANSGIGGATSGGGAYGSSYLGSNYRYASVDRLSNRQKIYENTGGGGSVGGGGGLSVGSGPPPQGAIASLSTSAVDLHNHLASLSAKRELFFRDGTGPAPTANGTGGGTPTAAPPTGGSSAAPISGAVVTTGGPGGTAAPTSTSGTISSMLLSSPSSVNLKREAAPPLQFQSSSHLNVDNKHGGGRDKDTRDRDFKSQAMPPTRDTNKDGGALAVSTVTTVNCCSALAKDNTEGYVGFANLPNQVYRKAVKKGFEFTLMVVGESGLGKSTLMNSMFLTDVYSSEYPGPSQRIKKTVEVESNNVLLKEGGVNLTLTIVDTPGFGDAVDNSECWQPITNYIETKYEEYLNAESRVHRSVIPDARVHCCLYFFAPSGHGLKPLDIEFMKRLHDKVNIIPLIAKADTMTPEECSLFKRTILNEIAQNKIKIYEFPDCDDEEDNKQQKILKERVPFAVVGSNTVIEVNGKKVRGRKYPWGVAEVENMEHCDFIALRNMLVRTHMQDLKDVTNNVHYENFRCRKLAGVGDGKQAKGTNKNPLAQMEEEKKEHENKMKRMEQEMEQVFEMKVREKMLKLKDSEADLQRRHEQMKKSLEQQRQELEEKRKVFEKEKSAFDLANKDIEEAFRRMSLDTNSKEHLDGKEKKKEKKKGLF